MTSRCCALRHQQPYRAMVRLVCTKGDCFRSRDYPIQKALVGLMDPPCWQQIELFGLVAHQLSALDTAADLRDNP